MDLCEFEASLVYRVSSKTARATQRNLVSKIQKRRREGAEKAAAAAMVPSGIWKYLVGLERWLGG